MGNKGVQATHKLLRAGKKVHLILGWAFSLWLLVGTVGSAAALPYTYIEVNVFPELKDATGIAVGKPGIDNDIWHMAAARDGRVLLYEVSDRTTAAYHELSGFPSPAVSVAFADYDGDGHDDLWVGSAGSGNVFVYGLSEGYPLLGKSSDRVWSRITQVLTPDIDGDKFADAVVLTEAGTVFAFLRREVGLVKLWGSGAREGKVQQLLAQDLNADGCAEIVMARDGYAAVWRWVPNDDAVTQPSYEQLAGLFPTPVVGAGALELPVETSVKVAQPAATAGKLSLIWERDSFQGRISGAAIGDFNKDGAAELLFSTSQNRLYVVLNDKTGKLATVAVEEQPQLASGLRMVIPGESSSLLFGAQGDSLAMWQHKGGTSWQFDTVWQSDFDLKFSKALVAGERLIFATGDAIRFYKRVPRTYVKVLVQGTPYNNLLADPVVVRGEVLLAAKDWSTLLNLQPPAWNPAGRVTLLQGLQYVVATLNSKEVVVSGRNATLKNEPRNIEGLVFLPAEVVNLLTSGITWYPRTRILSIR